MYIYGKNVVRSRIESNKRIVRAFVSDNFREQDIIDELRLRKVKINFVSNKILDKKVGGGHQGIILEVDEIRTYDIEEFLDSIDISNNLVVVMLDHLEDPHNFGAIIRTCEALGVSGIIIPSDRAVGITPTVIKTSVGTIENMKIVRVVNLGVAIKKLKDKGFWIMGTDMNGDDYTKVSYDMPVCLIIGNEGKGISRVVRKNCDFVVSIPMVGKVNSLNASVSCGIVLSQIVRGR
jgi:23S rRNA (guanosine2251-2'-O)-methyltransferase